MKKSHIINKFLIAVNVLLIITILTGLSFALYIATKTLPDNSLIIGKTEISSELKYKNHGDSTNTWENIGTPWSGGGQIAVSSNDDGFATIRGIKKGEFFTLEIVTTNNSNINVFYQLQLITENTELLQYFDVSEENGAPNRIRKYGNTIDIPLQPWDFSATTTANMFVRLTAKDTLDVTDVSLTFKLATTSFKKTALNTVDNATSLAEAKVGSYVKLAKDITVTDDITLNPINLDFAGYTITCKNFVLNNGDYNGSILLENGKIVADNITLTVPKGTINILDINGKTSASGVVTLQASSNTINLCGSTSFISGEETAAVPSVLDIKSGSHLVISNTITQPFNIKVSENDIIIDNFAAVADDVIDNFKIQISNSVTAGVIINNATKIGNIISDATTTGAKITLNNNANATINKIEVTGNLDISNGGSIGAIDNKNAAGSGDVAIEGVAPDSSQGTTITVSKPSVWAGGTVEIKPESYVIDTEGKTIRIKDAAAFAYFAFLATELIDSTTNPKNTFVGWTVILDCNIDLNNQPWEPIRYFDGIFDGNGKTVSNLNLKQVTYQNPYYPYTGLFSVVESKDDNIKAEIKNLTVNVNTTINYNAIGVIVGNAINVKLTNCHTNGILTITNNDAAGIKAGGIACQFGINAYDVQKRTSEMENCTSSVKITADNSCTTAISNLGNEDSTVVIGGLASNADNSIINGCEFSGTIKSKNSISDDTGKPSIYGGSKIGGLVGNLIDLGNISNCIFSGSMEIVDKYGLTLGGIAAYTDAILINITNTYIKSAIISTQSDKQVVGGILGESFAEKMTVSGSISGTEIRLNTVTENIGVDKPITIEVDEPITIEVDKPITIGYVLGQNNYFFVELVLVFDQFKAESLSVLVGGTENKDVKILGKEESMW